MIFVNMFHYLKGYVIIVVEGFFLERFINICTKRNIYLWDLKKLSNTALQVKISIRGFLKLRQVARKSKCRVKIKAKRGVPFILARYKKRYAFVFGIILFLALFYFLTSFVWVIDITGNETIPTEELMANLSQCGVNYGIYSSSIDTIELQNKLRTANQKLAWVGIEVSGCKVKVDVKERVMPPEIIDTNSPCNITAKKDGVIDRMIVRFGSTQVEEGNTVEKGQLLVSGIVSGENTPVQYINSDATIIAKTWYERRQELPLQKAVKNYTGNTLNQNYLEIFNFRINFYRKSSIPYSIYDTIENKKDFILFGKTLPITFVNQNYAEYTEDLEIVPADAVVSEFADAFETEIKNQDNKDFTVLNKIVEKELVGETAVKVRVLLECSEDIAQKEPINNQ